MKSELCQISKKQYRNKFNLISYNLCLTRKAKYAKTNSECWLGKALLFSSNKALVTHKQNNKMTERNNDR